MKIIGMGSNIAFPEHTSCAETLGVASELVQSKGISIVEKSKLYRTEPIPKSDQSWFINGVILVDTKISPLSLLKQLLEIEKIFGRVRTKKWEARVLDLDLIAYDHVISLKKPILPHPRMHERAFVLRPMSELVPTWVHPIYQKNIGQLLENIKNKQGIQPLENMEYPVNWVPPLQ